MIDFRKFFHSLKIAISGFKITFQKEQSFRIQVFMGLLVVLLMFILKLNPLEKSVLIIVIVMVLSLELINSQIERFLDVVQPNYQLEVKAIKDISAAAVLAAAFGAAAVGIIILLPHLFGLFG
ncbi:MAG TPA: diacylglycerol kinase [Candidatus Paceibacterota bacterium]|nr:diacylglycerol kinase [Candidatus Paceibacterota bacterium]